MEFIRRLEPLFLLLMVLGGLVWLIIGLFEVNVVTEVLGGGTAADVVYVLVGLAALLYLPRLFEALGHMGDHGVHPHRA
jgi:uncharacterized membrane protein YuzA (DUF378 family)